MGMLGFVMDRTHSYRTIWKSVFVGNVVTVLIVFVSLRPDNNTFLCMSCVLLGSTTIASLPVTLASAAEVSYPMPEQAFTSLLMFAGNIVGAIMIPIYGC